MTQVTKSNKEYYDLQAYGAADTESSLGGGCVEEYINRSFVSGGTKTLKKSGEIISRPFEFVESTS